MKTHPILRSLSLTLVAWSLLVGLGLGQRMPQDDWFFDYEIINHPAKGLHIDKQGNYYLGQTTRVKVLNAQAQPVREITGFTYVRGMCTNNAGDLFVLDSLTVKRYNPQGVPVISFQGILSAPPYIPEIQKDSYRQMLAINASGQICAIEQGTSRVNVFTQDGVFVRSFGEPGTAASQLGSPPYSITCLPDGKYVVAVTNSYTYYYYYDNSGTWLARYGVDIGNYTFYQNNISSTSDGLVVAQNSYDFYYQRHINPFVRIFSKGETIYSYIPGADNTMYPTSSDALRQCSYGIACRPNGDIVASTGTELRVWKRRFQNSHVAMAPKALPLPSVLTVSQRAGTAILDVDFKVDDADSPLVEVAIVAYKNGESKPSKLILPTSLVDGTQSSVGPAVQSNQVHRISWNVSADWDVETGSVSVEVLAKDDRLLKARKFAYAPGGTPTGSGILDYDPHSTWLWLLAKRYPAIKFENGNIVGVAAAIAGQILAKSVEISEMDWDGDGIIDYVYTYELDQFQSTAEGGSFLDGLYAQELGL